LSNEQYFDLIGDIHGHSDALHDLLELLGYQFKENCFQHPTRKVLFLGDFIDRGPNQKAVLNTVMNMVQQGHALAIMGNHEFNALAFHTKHPHQPNTWLRPRTEKNIKQHAAFLEAFEDNPTELESVLSFFWSLPLWIELEGIRAIHACWNDPFIEKLTPLVGPRNTLTKELLIDGSTENTLAFTALETLLKGTELPIPDNQHFSDKDGVIRHHVRTQWWHNTDMNLEDISMPPGILKDTQINHLITKEQLPGYEQHNKPLFIGHYWLTGKPTSLAHNVACLDYSIAKSGKLVAYRWSGETTLKDEHFIHV
jgi:hypothetical protein